MPSTDHRDAAGVVITTPRPVVGVTCAREPIHHGAAWHQTADFVPASYTAAVQRAGGRAVLLPVDPLDAERPHEALRGLDGLILTGGVDLSPDSYGAERHRETTGDTPDRDRFEAALALAAQGDDLPLLAICRGMQIVAAAGGGTLDQHVPETLGTDEHRRVPGTLDERNAHGVELLPGSLAARAVGSDVATVRSHHHQAVDRLPDGWTITGSAAGDGLTEAMERSDRTFCLAVQWHPEGDPRSAVIAALVQAAHERAAARDPADALDPTGARDTRVARGIGGAPPATSTGPAPTASTGRAVPHETNEETR